MPTIVLTQDKKYMTEIQGISNQNSKYKFVSLTQTLNCQFELSCINWPHIEITAKVPYVNINLIQKFITVDFISGQSKNIMKFC